MLEFCEHNYIDKMHNYVNMIRWVEHDYGNELTFAFISFCISANQGSKPHHRVVWQQSKQGGGCQISSANAL